MRASKKKSKRKKIIFYLILFVVILLCITSYFSFGTRSDVFYENLYSHLFENGYENLSINKEFLEDNKLYDDDFTCESISFNNGVLEFIDCIIEDEAKDYCVYDGDDFECYLKEEEADLNITFNEIDLSINDNGYSNVDIELDLNIEEASSNEIKKVLTCNTTLEKCIPVDELSGSTGIISLESDSSELCAMAEYTNGSVSEIFCSDSYKLDKTAPEISYNIKGDKGKNGWYLSDVSITNYSGTDSLSGLDKININKSVIDYETAGDSVVITATDLAGNKSVKTLNIKIDKTDPVVGDMIIDGTEGLNGWYTSDVLISVSQPIDSMSGIASSSLSNELIDYDTVLEKVVYVVSDNAGNTVTKEVELKVDKSAPDISYVIHGTKGLNDWYVTNVEFDKFKAVDEISEVSSYDISKSLIDYDTVLEEVVISAVDNAGNKVIETVKVKVDKTAPIAGDIVISGTEGLNGWYVSDLIISSTSGSDLTSGINDTVLSNKKIDYDTKSEKITLTTTDNAGNKSIKEIDVKVDTTKPSISYVIEGEQKLNDWYIEDVLITDLNYTDSTSGVDSHDISNDNINYETIGELVIITATDVAGNVAVENLTIKVDKTAPVVGDIVIKGTKGLNDWYITDLLISANGGSDSISGIASNVVSNELINYDTVREVLVITTTDNAGHVSTKDLEVKVDRTGPIISYDIEGSPGSNDWFISNVAILAPSAIDSMSGFNRITTSKSSFTTETAGTNLVITAYDNAGNSSVVNKLIKIDKTLPVIDDYEIVGTKGDNDWYITPVEVKNVLASDNLSGVNNDLLDDIHINIDYETTGKRIEFLVSDLAGNVTSKMFDIKIDFIDPLAGGIILDGDPGLNGWYNSDVTVTSTSGSDSVSGVKDNILNLDIVTGILHETKVDLTTTDNAGHKNVESTIVKIDKIVPEVGTMIVDGTKIIESSEWYVSDVTISKTDGIDDGSGHALTEVSLTEIQGNTVGTVVNITTTDQSGLKAIFSKTIRIDKETPVITQLEDIEINMGTSVDLTSKFSATYGVSGGNITCDVVDTSVLSGGVHNVVCTATSNAGLTDSINTTIMVSQDFEVLEYLESNGNQYFDSGIMNSGDYLFEDSIMATNVALNGGSWLFGGRSQVQHSIGIFATTSQTIIAYNSSTANIGNYISQGIWYTIEFSRKELVVNSTVVPLNYTTTIPEMYQEELRIGGNTVGYDDASIDDRYFVGRRKYFKITDVVTGELLRHFVPVKETNSGKYGFLDLVENKFYENEGTGSYIAP